MTTTKAPALADRNDARKRAIAKLPRWLQSEFTQQEREIERLNDEIAVLRQEPHLSKPGPMSVRVGGVMQQTPLPKGSSARVQVDPTWNSGWIDMSVRDDEPGCVRIRGGYRFAVEPEAANSIRVRLIDPRHTSEGGAA